MGEESDQDPKKRIAEAMAIALQRVTLFFNLTHSLLCYNQGIPIMSLFT